MKEFREFSQIVNDRVGSCEFSQKLSVTNVWEKISQNMLANGGLGKIFSELCAREVRVLISSFFKNVY